MFDSHQQLEVDEGSWTQYKKVTSLNDAARLSYEVLRPFHRDVIAYFWVGSPVPVPWLVRSLVGWDGAYGGASSWPTRVVIIVPVGYG